MTLIDARDIVTQPNGWTDCVPIGHAIHHTVTMMLSPNATIEDERNQIEAIDTYHVSQDFGGFGYHTITFPSGRSYLTGSWRRARAHVKYRNHELVGSVAAGTFTDAPAPPAIIAGLAECVAEARRVFGRELPINGHGQWADPRAPSSCPGQIRTQLGAISAALQESQEEDDMPLTDDDIKRIGTHILGILRSDEFRLVDINQRAGKYPGLPANPSLADIMNVLRAMTDGSADAKAIADEIAARLED